jgi:short-subunit dehydrogenase
VLTQQVDVTDADAVERWVSSTDAATPLDLVVACAGVAEAPLGIAADVAAAARVITSVNVGGVINTVLPALPGMRGRKRGQIAIISSLSSYLSSWPRYPAYGASKAWARSWGTALRGYVWDEGVRVSVVCPGFVATEMTHDRHLPSDSRGLPGAWTAARAARRIVDSLLCDEAIITFPTWLVNATAVVSHAPILVQDFMGRTRLGGEFSYGMRNAVTKAQAAAAKAATAAPLAIAASAGKPSRSARGRSGSRSPRSR